MVLSMPFIQWVLTYNKREQGVTCCTPKVNRYLNRLVYYIVLVMLLVNVNHVLDVCKHWHVCNIEQLCLLCVVVGHSGICSEQCMIVIYWSRYIIKINKYWPVSSIDWLCILGVAVCHFYICSTREYDYNILVLVQN